MSNFYYKVYGLHICSKIQFGSFAKQLDRIEGDDLIYIDFGFVNFQDLPYANPLIIRQNTEEGFVYVVRDVAAFLIKDNKILVQPICQEQNKWEAYLTGAVLSIVLVKNGFFNLHGSAISYASSAYMFLGVSGIGKSSLAAGLGKKGNPIITDDVCAIAKKQDKMCVSFGPTRMKVTANTVNQLGLGNETELEQLPHREKYSYPIDNMENQDSFPIRKIIELTVDESLAQEFIVEDINSIERIELLNRNTYKERLSDAVGVSPTAFEIMTSLAKKVEFVRITRKQKNGELKNLIQLVEDKILT